MADRATVGPPRLVRMDAMTAGDDKRSPCADSAAAEDEQMDPMVKRLYATTDAAVWATEFLTVVGGGAALDFGFVVGWFANAIETAKAHDRQSRAPIEDEVVVLPRTALFEFLGEMALPPWKDERGRTIGRRIDCAPIAQRLSEWVDAHDMTGVVDVPLSDGYPATGDES